MCPTDYRLWQQSMYALFGTKWTKLHGGPMWSTGQDGTDGENRNFIPAEVLAIHSHSDLVLQVSISNRRDLLSQLFLIGHSGVT